jgi:hypothetical protein
LILLLFGCGVPEACDAMCARAADGEAACLEERQLTWTSAGYADRDDFVAHCGTWAWEEVRLSGSAAAEICAERRDSLDGTCAAYEALDW